jgi:hypothetical protein
LFPHTAAIAAVVVVLNHLLQLYPIFTIFISSIDLEGAAILRTLMYGIIVIPLPLQALIKSAVVLVLEQVAEGLRVADEFAVGVRGGALKGPRVGSLGGEWGR